DPLPVEETPLVYVDNVEKLTELRDILNKEKEFAVDVEHHDYRSFLGLTCLVQISTRTVDYIIDPFPIWQHMHILNEPFVDPKILKVFHGANKDMEWLQRDFGIYVVNMFDTGRAMRLLQFPKFSLQYLVQLYCNESLNKEYQLTDWRIRPLPSDYQTYARCDTHYLLFCYDKLRQRLLESSNERKNLISAVYTASREICLTVYSKPQFDADGYDRFVTIRKSLNNRQLFALKELWRWRDETARTNDESRAYILPDHMLLQIAEALPREMQGILACCNPIPALVKTSLHELHRIILAARERPLEAKMTLTKNPPTLPTDARRSSLAWLNTPHDHSFSKIDEEIRPLARGDESRLEAVVEKQYSRLLNLMDTICKEQPSIHLFASAVDTAKQAASPTKGTSSNKGTSLKQATSLKRSFADWASPYDCYRVAVTKREEEELKKRAAVSEQTAKKSKWSHHDPSSGRGSKPREIRSTPIEDSSETAKETAEVTIGIDEEMTLTDRALRKRRKNEKGTTDVAFNLKETLAEPSQMKKGKWSDETRHANIQPVDYSNFASDIFNQKPSKAGTFDPHRTSSVRRGRGGRRGGRRGGGGGLDRARPKTQSFGGRNK
uniref:HRDC domain-containing protein n=1 Tax=Plectus sambesii TaxID=2011161 RepID=A0A914WTF1_9BILA